jgi:hypothetical protein
MLYPTELQARAAIIATYTAGGNRGRGDCARDCARQLPGGLEEVGGRDDVIPLIPLFLHALAQAFR